MFMAEKGIDMPKQTVDLRKGENREAEHLKRNPHGQMPTLELDDGSYLSEITAICEYLEEKNPTPADDRDDAGRARRMPDVDAPRRSQYLRAARQRLSLRRGAEVLREAHPRRARSLARPEDDRGQPPAMAQRPDGEGKDYLCGKRFTMADILLYCWLDFGDQVGQPLDPANANIAAWFARVANGLRRRRRLRHSRGCAGDEAESILRSA